MVFLQGSRESRARATLLVHAAGGRRPDRVNTSELPDRASRHANVPSHGSARQRLSGGAVCVGPAAEPPGFAKRAPRADGGDPPLRRISWPPAPRPSPWRLWAAAAERPSWCSHAERARFMAWVNSHIPNRSRRQDMMHRILITQDPSSWIH